MDYVDRMMVLELQMGKNTEGRIMTTQRNVAQEIAPKMAELSANVLF